MLEPQSLRTSNACEGKSVVKGSLKSHLKTSLQHEQGFPAVRTLWVRRRTSLLKSVVLYRML